MDPFLQKVIDQRNREQYERDCRDLKRPKCEHCDVPLRGGRSHQPPGKRICADCERKR